MPWVTTRYGPTKAQERAEERRKERASTKQKDKPPPAVGKTPAAVRETPPPAPRRLRPPPTGLAEPITEKDWDSMESLGQDPDHPAPLDEARTAKQTRLGKTPKNIRATQRYSQMMEDPALRQQADQRLNQPEHRVLMARDGRVPEACLLLQPDAWTEGVKLDHPLIREWSCHIRKAEESLEPEEWKQIPQPGLADPEQIREIIQWTSERRIALLRYAADQRGDGRGDMRAVDTLIACIKYHRPQRGG